MRTTAQLTVQAGPDKGRVIDLVPGSIRIGRSRDNEVRLSDPILSRQHCRIDLTERGELSVTDLDSANETMVNGASVRSSPLKTGDAIVIGDTRLVVTVLANAAGADAPSLPTPAPKTTAHETAAPPPAAAPVFVDLGFDGPERPSTHTPTLRPLLWVIGAAALLLLGAALIMRMPARPTPPTIAALPDLDLLPLEIHYEKVEGTSNSIFRYEMTLSPAMRLSIAIDDLAENRNVREEAVVATNLVRELAREIDRSGFFSLNDAYEGIARDGLLNTYEITVLQGNRIKRCLVVNRVEPEVFLALRERLETFGKNELGIWAIQFSRDKLLTLANEAFTRARNSFDERGIAYGNTAMAIRRFKEAAFYLETIEPKPDFYGELVSLLAQAEEELTQRYEDQRFLADIALNMKEWGTAARELRVLREIVPDPADPRNSEAARKLLDVENRLKSKGKP